MGCTRDTAIRVMSIGNYTDLVMDVNLGCRIVPLIANIELILSFPSLNIHLVVITFIDAIKILQHRVYWRIITISDFFT